MRELKFRAWDIEQSKMYTPSYTFDKTGDLCTDGLFLNGSENENEGLIAMQFTGLKDKNGVEIYEGDIIEFKTSLINDKSLKRAFIDYDAPSYWLYFNKEKNSMTGIINLLSNHNSGGKVIGNIYEHPELLTED